MTREGDRMEKLYLLREQYPNSQPAHRETRIIRTKAGSQRFAAGRFLSSLGESIRRGYSLPAEVKEEMMDVPWFAAWYAQQKHTASLPTPGLPPKPTINEQIELLIDNYPSQQPVRGETRIVSRVDGRPYELNGQMVLDKIASVFHADTSASKYRVSEELCEQLRVLPWAKAWIERSAERRATWHMRKVVTKDMKLELVLHYYRENRPAWDDPAIPVTVPGSDTFYFRPATWIDDLADNWLTDRRPNVTLDANQMEAMESLPWVEEWLAGVIRRRK